MTRGGAHTMTRLQAIQTARQMYANGQGWSIAEIKRYLAEHGQRPHWTTLKNWVDDEYAARRRDQLRERKRRHSRDARGTSRFLILDDDALRRLGFDGQGPPSKLTPELLFALRVEDGLTYSAIAAVARRFFGEDMTEDQARHRLYELGVEKNPNKARAARRQHNQLKVAA